MSIHAADQIIKRLTFESSGKVDFQNAKSLFRVQVKAASYTVTEADSGSIFTTYGGSAAITFTLPSNPKRGLWYLFVNAVNQNMVITGDSTELITFNNATATSVTYSTGSQKIGATCLVFADGNSFYALNLVDSCADTIA